MPKTARLPWPASVRASEDSSCLRPLGYRDRLYTRIYYIKLQIQDRVISIIWRHAGVSYRSSVRHSYVFNVTFRISAQYLVYLHSCCSHLEHRASVKRFVSLQFHGQSVGLLGQGISPSQGRYLYRTTQTQNKRKHPCLEWDSNPRSQYSNIFHALDFAVTVIGPYIELQKFAFFIRMREDQYK
jgi:hypothetical protein